MFDKIPDDLDSMSTKLLVNLLENCRESSIALIISVLKECTLRLMYEYQQKETEENY